MMPLYIAEFEFTKQDSRSRAYSVVLEAHNENVLPILFLLSVCLAHLSLKPPASYQNVA